MAVCFNRETVYFLPLQNIVIKRKTKIPILRKTLRLENVIPNSSTPTSLGQNGFKKVKRYATVNTVNISNRKKQLQTYLLTSFTRAEVQLNGAAHSAAIPTTRTDES